MGLRLRVWSKYQDTERPCAVPVSKDEPGSTLPLVVPGKSYALETSVKFEGTRAACDIFIEPLAKFGKQEASLGMIFQQTVSPP